MKNVWVVMVSIIFFSPLVTAKEINYSDSAVFEVPDAFTALTSSEIANKFPSNRAPKYVVGNKRRSTTIAWDLKPRAIPADKLEQVKVSFVRLFERIVPGLAWIKRDIIELAGQQWILLEMTSNAIDTDIHNIMLLTSHQGKMLVFNFNSTKAEFPEVENILRHSIRSIKLL